MADGFQFGEWDAHIEHLEDMAKYAGKRQKQFLRKEVKKLQRLTKANARIVGKITGKYLTSIKTGKVYTKDDLMAIRVYTYSPHAHLLEDGHDQVVNPPKRNGQGVIPGRGIGRTVGHVPGRWVFSKAYNGFIPIFLADCENLIDEEIAKL